MQVRLQNGQLTFVCQRYRVKVKVTGAKKHHVCISQGQHWPVNTLPPNSLPPNIAATNLR